MGEQNVHLTDWKRLLFGVLPGWFPLEVFVRTVLMYVALIVILRILGKRLSGQLTILELGVMITLGGIVSAPMVLADKSLLIGVVLLLGALTFLRGLGRAGVASEKFERIAHGEVSMLAVDGRLVLDELKSEAFSKNQLFAGLRSTGIKHLGEVERVYLETPGLLTVWKRDPSCPGLSIFPQSEELVTGVVRDSDLSACAECGEVTKNENRTRACPNCQANHWRPAMKLEEIK